MNARSLHGRPVDWGDLETFLAAARLGTLAAAATELRVDASTVHRRLAKLEAAMRAKLFLRSQRGYALTEAGQELLTHTDAMADQATAALRKVAARDEQPVGTVRVSTVDALANSVLPSIVSTFRDKHPNVTVVLDLRETFADLAKREADVAIRFVRTPMTGDAVARRIASTGFALFASRAYVKKHGRPKTAEELFDHAMVRGDERFAASATERIADRFGDRAKIALRATSYYTICSAIRDGVGIGFAPLFLASGDNALQRFDIDFGDPLQISHLHLLIHADMRKNARVRAFVEHAYAALIKLRRRFEHGTL